MSSSPLVSCVSGTVEGRLEALKRMVGSVRESIKPFSYEIILVACECKEATHQWIRSQPDCVLVIRPKREGSVVAFNDGFSRARGKFAVTLNDDIVVDGDTIARSIRYLNQHPEVGQVAFGHKYQNRGGNTTQPKWDAAYGYTYGQCCTTRKWLGDVAGWWGNFGLVHYGGDTHLGLRVWQLGYRVQGLQGCTVTDWEIEDDTRVKFSHAPRAAGGGVHPDVKLFRQHWDGRMPPPDKWKPVQVNRVIVKAAEGTLRTLRFKAHMAATMPKRVALLNAFREYGPAMQANQTMAVAERGRSEAQEWFITTAEKFQPDLVMLQGQRPNNITPETASRLCKRLSGAFVFNWDADTHYPMLPFHEEIAKAVPLQLTISPSLFEWYRQRGVHNIGYWPIGVEQEFIDVDRYEHFREEASSDVLFLGSLYGEEVFPGALTRRDAVIALHRSNLRFRLHGLGWPKIGIQASSTLEEFAANAILYSKAKMALSVSQTNELWGYTSDRAHNILATGCPLLVERFVGHKEYGLVDGETCIAWSSIPEMLEKARYYIAHPHEREAIGRAGKQVLLERYTWPRLVEELWGLIAPLGA